MHLYSNRKPMHPHNNDQFSSDRCPHPSGYYQRGYNHHQHQPQYQHLQQPHYHQQEHPFYHQPNQRRHYLQPRHVSFFPAPSNQHHFHEAVEETDFLHHYQYQTNYDNAYDNHDMRSLPPPPLTVEPFPINSTSSSTPPSSFPNTSEQTAQARSPQSAFLSEDDFREHLMLQSLEEETKTSSARDFSPHPGEHDLHADNVARDSTHRHDYSDPYQRSYDQNVPDPPASTPPRSCPPTRFRHSTPTNQMDPNIVSPLQHSGNSARPIFQASMENSDDMLTTSPSSKHDENDDGSPRSCDVLCGQSRSCAAHPGNRVFQQILNDQVDEYSRTSSKQQKMQMTKAIVGKIHGFGGKFLKYDKDSGEWIQISDVLARDKTSHALRTKVANRNRNSQQGILESNVYDNVHDLYDAQQRILQRGTRSQSKRNR